MSFKQTETGQVLSYLLAFRAIWRGNWFRQMKELSEIEKQIALLVIREMEKNPRNLQDLQLGADAVLKVFREVTAPPRRFSLKRRVLQVLLPFSKH